MRRKSAVPRRELTCSALSVGAPVQRPHPTPVSPRPSAVNTTSSASTLTTRAVEGASSPARAFLMTRPLTPKTNTSKLPSRSERTRVGTHRLASSSSVSGSLRGGPVVFTQRFGSSLQLTPHLAALLPEELWMKDGEEVTPPAPDAAFGGVDSPAGAVRREVRRAALARRRRTTSCLHRGRRSDRVR